MSDSYQVKAADRFITTSPARSPVVVHRGSTDIVYTDDALKLSEGALDDVYYLPMGAVPDGLLETSSREYYCRWKGDARFFNVRVGDEVIVDGAWSYPQAPDELAELRERVAFDADHFTMALDLCTHAVADRLAPEEPA